MDTTEIILEEIQVAPETITKSVISISTVGLVYTIDTQIGYKRQKIGKKFYYWDVEQTLTDQLELARIKSLIIPPAWEDVWICKLENGHLQATGYDQINRKQYRYHPLWIAIRNQSKFYQLNEFGKRLPAIRANLEKDLALRGLPQRKVLAAMVSLLDKISIRFGNVFYEKLYGSFGLTTLNKRPLKVEGVKLLLSFIEKKGVRHKITLASKRLANIVKGCKEIPGKVLFEYYDEEGNIDTVDSGMLNNYINDISGGNFTAKDFRTWAGSLLALVGFKELGGFENIREMNKKIAMVVELVAKQLGNTRKICKKYYIHPLIILLYREKKLEEYICDLNDETKNKMDGYVDEEIILLRILEKEHSKNKHLIG